MGATIVLLAVVIVDAFSVVKVVGKCLCVLEHSLLRLVVVEDLFSVGVLLSIFDNKTAIG